MSDIIKDELQNLNADIVSMKAKLDTMNIEEIKEDYVIQYKEFLKTCKELLELRATNKILYNELEDAKGKNKRNAGRKKKITDDKRYSIILEYANGISEFELAENYDCSVNTIKRIISEALAASR